MTSGMSDDRDDRYEAAIEWLKLMLALVTAAALTVIYLLMPDPTPGSVQEFIKACLPNLVSALIVFPAVFIVLGRVNLSTKDRIAQTIRQSLDSTEKGLTFANDVSGTADFVRDIIAKKSSQTAIKIEILAFTGGTFTTALLRDLVQLNPNKLHIVLRTIDFSRAQNKDSFPSHWEHEEAETVTRLKELCADQATLQIWRYPAFPFLLGLNIDESHLLITFPFWNHRTGKLADQSLEYRYYRRNAGSEYLFDLFENWRNQPDQTLLHSDTPHPTR